MPETSLQELKQHPRILDLYRSRLSLKQDGRRWRGPCPYHVDKHATNFDVYPHEGTLIFKCMSCGQAGSILDLLQKTDSVDFKGAVAIARQFTSEWSQNASKVESTFKPLGQEEKVRKTYSLEEYGRLENALKNSADARKFLATRGITLETAQRLRIGFRQDVGKLAGDAGAEVAASGWLAFPTFNQVLSTGDPGVTDGPKSVVGSLKYRSVARKAFCKQPGMSTELFNRETIDMLEPVFLVEGEFDALTLEQAGFKAVSLPNAQYQPTPEDKDLLLSAEYVVLAGDNDEAGRKAMEKLWREMNETGRVFYLKWPGAVKDANQLYLEDCKGDIKAFRAKINELTLTAKSHPIPHMVSLPEAMQQSSRASLEDHPDRLHFPWKNVDSMVNLLPGSVLNITATQTGMGKTSFLAQLLMHAARAGRTVINYSAELSAEEYSVIVAAQLLKKHRNDIAEGDLQAAAKMISGVKFYVGQDPDAPSSDKVLDLIDKAIPILGADVVAIDHIHHICQGKNNDVKDQNESIVRIKNIASKRGVCMIVVSQPRKSDSNNRGKEIHITDIKGGGGIADASDAVISLHREFIKTIDPENPPAEPYDSLTKIRLLKGRSQGRGKAYCELLFLGPLATFSEVARFGEPTLFEMQDRKTPI